LAKSASKSVCDDQKLRTSFFFSIRYFFASSTWASVQSSQLYASNWPTV